MPFDAIPSAPHAEVTANRIQEIAQRFIVNTGGEELLPAVAVVQAERLKAPYDSVFEDRKGVYEHEEKLQILLQEHNIHLPEMRRNGVDVSLDYFIEQFTKMMNR